MNLDVKNKIKKLEVNKNKLLCFLVLGLIILVIGLLFLPICLVTYRRVTTFAYSSFEAILFYLCTAIGLILSIVSLVLFLKVSSNIKKLKKIMINFNEVSDGD